MSKVQIDVGIPTMDNERTIWETLFGFANQTRPPNSIHIVDASTDRTYEIIDIFKNTVNFPFTIHLDKQTDGRGVGAARNKILKKSTGDILAFFDTDATPSETWTEKHIRAHNQHPSIDIVSGINGGVNEEIIDTPTNKNYLVQKNCSIKRRALESVNGWDSKFTRGEDWDIALRLWQAGTKSLVRNDLGRQPIDIGSLRKRLRLRLGRPSSVRFLRKYGIWYFKIHPIHVLGDAISIISSLILFLSIPLSGLIGAKAFLLLIVPFLGTVGALVVKYNSRGIDGLDLRFFFRTIPEFFLLGFTSIREFFIGPRSGWNYGGVK